MYMLVQNTMIELLVVGMTDRAVGMTDKDYRVDRDYMIDRVDRAGMTGMLGMAGSVQAVQRW